MAGTSTAQPTLSGLPQQPLGPRTWPSLSKDGPAHPARETAFLGSQEAQAQVQTSPGLTWGHSRPTLTCQLTWPSSPGVPITLTHHIPAGLPWCS